MENKADSGNGMQECAFLIFSQCAMGFDASKILETVPLESIQLE